MIWVTTEYAELKIQTEAEKKNYWRGFVLFFLKSESLHL